MITTSIYCFLRMHLRILYKKNYTKIHITLYFSHFTLFLPPSFHSPKSLIYCPPLFSSHSVFFPHHFIIHFLKSLCGQLYFQQVDNSYFVLIEDSKINHFSTLFFLTIYHVVYFLLSNICMWFKEKKNYV